MPMGPIASLLPRTTPAGKTHRSGHFTARAPALDHIQTSEFPQPANARATLCPNSKPHKVENRLNAANKSTNKFIVEWKMPEWQNRGNFYKAMKVPLPSTDDAHRRSPLGGLAPATVSGYRSSGARRRADHLTDHRSQCCTVSV